MKKRLFLIASLLIAVKLLFAQNCSSYYYFQNNAEVEMSVLDAKGKAMVKNTYKVLSVKKEGASTVSDFSITTKNDKGATVSSGKGQCKCKGGELLMDMKKFVPDMFPIKDMKVESDGNSLLSYPANMKEGQKLADGALQMSGSAEGMEMNLECLVTDRKVAGREKVTTAGGTWDCLKITCKVNLTVKMMSMNVPVQMDMTEWFAPDFGVVKINTDKDGKSAGVMEVTKVKK
ncbi:DUF3108 domain-containing protein [Chitinophaga rhizophila]|uniref:DUF3108 domain-containing protein n=1 Tax=Chitinophaga rhizophila TaxID=2866212 RepID=A0ABS7G9Q9_9BACT|nr:DUF3108 domain-containing protein [Chitinophaga rhizophila]MBW8684398.1 DUF3108 domain-containing protein [Chitinophaga rhizophila]